MAGPRVRVRKRARADLEDIGRYTRQRWGREQSIRYLGDLDACFRQLVSTASLGRAYAPLPPYWRCERGSHVVFFRREPNGDVVVVRVLHRRMLPELHVGKKDDERE